MGYLNHATATDGGTQSTSVVVDKPTGLSDGDLMFFIIHFDFQNNGAGHVTWPAGWTPIPSVDGEADSNIDQASLAVAYKVASSEGANYTATLAFSDFWCAAVVAYNNCPASPYDTGVNSGHDITADAGPSWTIDALSLTTATDNETLLWVGAIDNVNTFAVIGTITYDMPSGFTSRGTVADPLWCSMAWGDKVQATAGSSGSISSTASVISDTGNAGQMAALIAFKQNATTGNLAWIRA